MNKQQKKYPQRPTRIPYMLLSFKGRWDARRSERGVEAYCGKLRLREMTIETRDVAAVERETYPIREAVSLHLTARRQLMKRLALPSTPPGGADPASIRLQRRDEQEREAARKNLTSCEQELISLQESLIHTHTLLEERLNECRTQTREAITLYLKDVPPAARAGQYQEVMGTDHMEAYLARHEELDSELRRTVELLRKKEGS